MWLHRVRKRPWQEVLCAQDRVRRAVCRWCGSSRGHCAELCAWRGQPQWEAASSGHPDGGRHRERSARCGTPGGVRPASPAGHPGRVERSEGVRLHTLLGPSRQEVFRSQVGVCGAVCRWQRAAPRDGGQLCPRDRRPQRQGARPGHPSRGRPRPRRLPGAPAAAGRPGGLEGQERLRLRGVHRPPGEEVLCAQVGVRRTVPRRRGTPSGDDPELHPRGGPAQRPGARPGHSGRTRRRGRPEARRRRDRARPQAAEAGLAGGRVARVAPPPGPARPAPPPPPSSADCSSWMDVLPSRSRTRPPLPPVQW
mmetsp:Transcript_89416/g.282976  ORF Transcript_89416/g.282976 Transcript_89416/m.282976 type:complete len:309 (+) Transcript_89416:448-1374(+)